MDFHLDALLNLPNVTVFTYYQKEGYKKPAQICPAFAAVRAIHSIFLVRCQKILCTGQKIDSELAKQYRKRVS
jgi:hypothetical protein